MSTHRLWQDPKHVSKSTQQWMKDNDIVWWPTPAESPDMNPIENLWASLKYYIRHRVKPSTKEELVEGILAFWKTVTPEVCNNYINHLYKVIPEVVRRNGAATGM